MYQRQHVVDIEHKIRQCIITRYANVQQFHQKHSGLDGKTPAESAKILVDGPNKWKTIIQNASLHKRSL